MAKQKIIGNQRKQITRRGKKGEKKKKMRRAVIDKGPKQKRADSPIYGINSPHPDKVSEPKSWWDDD